MPRNHPDLLDKVVIAGALVRAVHACAAMALEEHEAVRELWPMVLTKGNLQLLATMPSVGLEIVGSTVRYAVSVGMQP